MRTLRRLSDYMAEQTGIRVEYETVGVHLKAPGITLSRPQSTPSHEPRDPEYASKKAIEETRDNLGVGDVLYYVPTNST